MEGRSAWAGPTDFRGSWTPSRRCSGPRLADGELSGATELRIDTSRLAAGVYVVRVDGETFAETRRLTVVHSH